MRKRTNQQIASQIVKAIETDLNDRSGLHLDSLDIEIQREIRTTWRNLVMSILVPAREAGDGGGKQ